MNTQTSPSELTLRAIVLGVLLSIILGAANAYLGLKVGMTVSASIPAAVVSMALLAVMRKATENSQALENNLVQTAASAPEIGGHTKGIEHLNLLTAGEVKTAVAPALATGSGL